MNIGGIRNPWDAYSPRQRYVFLLLLFLVATMNYVDKNVIGVVLEPIKAEFKLSDTELGFISGTSFAIFYATMAIPVARWSDRGDRKLIVAGSLALWSIATILCGLAPNFWSLALARMGVGATETGAIPPSQSLIADYFPPNRRGLAIGAFMLSAFAGGTLALALGSLIAETYGWRAVFVAAGLPGILLALIVYLVIDEPRRRSGGPIQVAQRESTLAAIGTLMAKPAYVYNLIAKVIYFTVSYGSLTFVISFMVRCHGLSLAQAGGLYAVISGTTSLVGGLAGGVIADRLASRDVAWLALVPAIALLGALPLGLIAFAAQSTDVMAAALFAMLLLFWSSSPSMFSALHLVCGSSRRTLAVAIVFCIANLVGLGLGPVLTGVISDYFAAGHGKGEGLRYALMAMTGTLAPGGVAMLLAARYMKRDVEA